MKEHGRLYLLGTFVCSILGVAMLLFALLNYSKLILCILALFSAVAWLSLAYVLYRQNLILQAVVEAKQRLGFDNLPSEITSLVYGFSTEVERFYEALKLFRGEYGISRSEQGASLRKLSRLIYQLLNANAVELSLFDEESGLWSQALVIGAPQTSDTQSMLSSERLVHKCEIIKSRDRTIIVMPILFAGTMFGAFRVELHLEQEVLQNDIDLLQILSTQGAIILVAARFTEELIRMRRSSEESVRAKTGFLANLSHEIRGPLGVILNGVELIMDGLCGVVTEQQNDTLRMVKDSGEHLLDLVNDVLDYAKVEAGKIIAKPIPISLYQLLDDLVTVVRSQAISKGHSLVLTPVDKTLGMICDKRHARQMLINFLTNAIKYTPENGSIEVSAVRIAGNRVKISIKDSGIGIPEAQRSKVFAAFERVDDQYALAQIGTGLGMPLTKRLAEVNQGIVDFDSTEGVGSTFWLIMPATQIAVDEVSTTDSQVKASQIKQGHGEAILLIDHDAATRQMLGQYLTSQGFDILLAKSGSEVISILRNKQIELAVVENDMPNLPGEEMVATIRAHPSTATVPIILLSSKAFVFDIERFLKLGVDRCLSKPVTLNELATTARRLIDETRSS